MGFVISAVGIFVYRGFYFGLYDTVRPMFPENTGVFTSFCLGYAVTVSAGLASYPIDTIRRRMMMTSGSAVKYNGSMDAAMQIEERGRVVVFQGRGSQYSARNGGRGNPGGLRRVQEDVHQLHVPAGLRTKDQRQGRRLFQSSLTNHNHIGDHDLGTLFLL